MIKKTDLKNLYNPKRREKFATLLTNENFGISFKQIPNVRTKIREIQFSKLKHVSALLYGYFILFTNSKKHIFYCYPSWETIKKNLHISTSGLQVALKELETMDIIRIYKIPKESSKYFNNIYFLMDYIGTKQITRYITSFKEAFDFYGLKSFSVYSEEE